MMPSTTAQSAPTSRVPVNRIDERTVEAAFRLAKDRQRRHILGFAEKGLRLARQRHPAFMAALEGMAEVTDRMSEHQYGRMVRDTGTDFAHRTRPTEATLLREAFLSADRGEASEFFQWYYGAAADLAGL